MRLKDKVARRIGVSQRAAYTASKGGLSLSKAMQVDYAAQWRAVQTGRCCPGSIILGI